MSTALTDAILAMDEDGALQIVKDRLDGGEAPEAVLEDAKAAMTVLGERFACEEVFIPELIMGGEIMKGIAAELKPRITAVMRRPRSAAPSSSAPCTATSTTSARTSSA